MNAMRTVTLLEHELVPIWRDDRPTEQEGEEATWFTETEADALLRLNKVQAGFCERVTGGMKFAQYCGVVRLPTCTVEVLPKLGMADHRISGEADQARSALLTMLEHSQFLKIRAMGSVAQHAIQAPLMDIFIAAFLDCVLLQAHRGMLSRYRPHSDDLLVIKGRFDAAANYLHNACRPHLLRCEYDEFTADNAYNRAIRATLDICRAWVRQKATLRLWHEAHARFSSIPSTRMSASDVARLPRERTTRRYEDVLAWCERLLAMKSPALKAGTAPAPGLLFDMNKLFESYVASITQSNVSEGQLVRTRGAEQRLVTDGREELFRLKPDVTVWDASKSTTHPALVRLIDAKWKRVSPTKRAWGVNEDDIYQMLAYSVRYGLDEVELAYPAPDSASLRLTPPIFKVQGNCGVATSVRMALVPILSSTSALAKSMASTA